MPLLRSLSNEVALKQMVCSLSPIEKHVWYLQLKNSRFSLIFDLREGPLVDGYLHICGLLLQRAFLATFSVLFLRNPGISGGGECACS